MLPSFLGYKEAILPYAAILPPSCTSSATRVPAGELYSTQWRHLSCFFINEPRCMNIPCSIVKKLWVKWPFLPIIILSENVIFGKVLSKDMFSKCFQGTRLFLLQNTMLKCIFFEINDIKGYLIAELIKLLFYMSKITFDCWANLKDPIRNKKVQK